MTQNEINKLTINLYEAAMCNGEASEGRLVTAHRVEVKSSYRVDFRVMGQRVSRALAAEYLAA